MPKFRKKPVVIEAMTLTFENAQDVAAWCGGRLCHDPDPKQEQDVVYLLIPTLEGNMRADMGSAVIRGVAGEFYPCKPDIFAATYEPVED